VAQSDLRNEILEDLTNTITAGLPGEVEALKTFLGNQDIGAKTTVGMQAHYKV